MAELISKDHRMFVSVGLRFVQYVVYWGPLWTCFVIVVHSRVVILQSIVTNVCSFKHALV